ncbi:hypothetical protein NM688_g472 [Phlebia brevispora]|uniref:Uncharacterized protein n=1 Tax=Phlebia brevispora TaxID=194682 RepID=A0ACC1TE43_9APHY|nr:hypothetical protein NM688_g472 [Phlebia brevispora]
MSSEHSRRTHVPSAKQRQIEDARAEKLAVNQAKCSKPPRNDPSEVQKHREGSNSSSPIHLQHADPHRLFDDDCNTRNIDPERAHLSDSDSEDTNMRARKKHRETSPEDPRSSDDEHTTDLDHASGRDREESLYGDDDDYGAEEADADHRGRQSDRASSPEEDDRQDVPPEGSQLAQHRSSNSASRQAETDHDEGILRQHYHAQKLPLCIQGIQERVIPTTSKTGSKRRDHRGQLADYDNISAAVIELAWETYEAYCMTNCLFPETDSKVETHLVHASWKDACTNLDQPLKMTPKEFKMIARRATHFRSESKKVVHVIVAQIYSFRTGQSAKTKDFNITHVAKLKNDRAFMRPLDQLDSTLEQRTGLYCNRAIGQFLNVALFKKNSGLGVIQAHLFGSAMPIPTLAYALTMLEYSISEWSTGYFEDTTFRISDWKLPYYTHIEDLKKFEERMAWLDVYKRIAGKLLGNARAHAGVGPVGAPTYVGAIAEEVFDNELATYEAGQLKSDDEEVSSDDKHLEPAPEGQEN